MKVPGFALLPLMRICVERLIMVKIKKENKKINHFGVARAITRVGKCVNSRRPGLFSVTFSGEL